MNPEKSFAGKKRYLSEQTERDNPSWLDGARLYVSNLTGAEIASLYAKPYHYDTGNATFYALMYDALNLLKAMGIPPDGKIVEVGSGPGWITELLMCLGFEVDALEPSAALIAIAQERIRTCCQHFHLPNSERVHFHCTSLEECTLPGQHYDAVLFYASLHHIVDEETGIAQSFRLLRPGGLIGISEGAWVPGDLGLEIQLDAAMRRFSTLENPFTVEYLDYLLQQHGFSHIERYHPVNGLFAQSQGNLTIQQVASGQKHNIVTAIKPLSSDPTTLDENAQTLGRMTVLKTQFDRRTFMLQVEVKLTNLGNSTWLHRSVATGYVTLALRQGHPGEASLREAAFRSRLPVSVLPGQEIVMQASFRLPPDYSQQAWFLDLVNEGYFWFSARGTTSAELWPDKAAQI